MICAKMRILRQDKKETYIQMSCAILILQATGAPSAHWGNKSGHGDPFVNVQKIEKRFYGNGYV